MIEKLLKKNLCTLMEAEELAKDLEQMNPELQSILSDWLIGRPYTDIWVKGFSIQSLMENYDLEFTGALLTLDWISKEPDAAIKALEYGIR